MTVVFGPLAVVMFVPGYFRWWMAPIYWALYLWFLGPFVLMLHNTTHRVLFKKQYRLLNKYIPWVCGPFVGMSPETYAAHHMGMHHVDGNLPDDLSSTMKHQRDSVLSFVRYFLEFLFSHPRQTAYFLRRGKTKFAVRFWIGELYYLGLTAALLAFNWRPALVVLVVPLLFSRLALMAGNWGQHAFVDHDDPTNDYRTVITFVNSPYNHRCFNDGYHLGHHLKASRHWLDMPADFAEKRAEMVRQGSLVFRKLDYFMITVLLLAKQYRTLARYRVELDPKKPKSEDEVVALFKSRVRRFDKATLESLRKKVPAPVAREVAA